MALEDELAKLTRRRGGPGKPRGERGFGFAVAAIGAGLLVVIVALVALSGFARTGPNEVGVVYNGGPLDKKTQRQLIAPSSGLTWTGWLSQDPRLYPSEGSPRRYIITSAPERRATPLGVDNVRLPKPRVEPPPFPSACRRRPPVNAVVKLIFASSPTSTPSSRRHTHVVDADKDARRWGALVMM